MVYLARPRSPVSQLLRVKRKKEIREGEKGGRIISVAAQSKG